MKVVWTREAEKHLDGIYEYIAQDAVIYARRMVDKLTRRSQQLAEFPQSGRVVPEYGDKNLRELIESPYRIVYKINSDRIDVIAVFHGAQLLPESL